MSDPLTPNAIWEWFDWIWGVILGVVGAIAGMLAWINPKFREADEKLNKEIDYVRDDIHKLREIVDAKVDVLHGRITAMEKLLVALQENHKATMQLYQGVSEGLKELTKLTNQQTKMLYTLIGRDGGHAHEDE